MTLYVVPLESYDLRYTEQWNRWFPRATTALGLDAIYFNVAEETRSPLGRHVLNDIRTNQHRVSQLSDILRIFERGEVQDGDTFLFHTLWFPGLEVLAYLRDTLGLKFRIVAVLHAGSYDEWDFRALAGMDPWAAPLENSWLAIADKVILASQFHRDMVIEARSVDPEKLVVTGLPFDSSEVQRGRELLMKNKLDLVAYPHRPAIEKRPDLVPFLRSHFGVDRVLVTRERSSSKAEYLDLLAGAKVCVSDSMQETFGYSMLEAVALGCIPLVPDRLSYREMYPARYRFTSRADLVQKVGEALSGRFGSQDDLLPLIEWADGSIHRVLEATLSDG